MCRGSRASDKGNARFLLNTIVLRGIVVLSGSRMRPFVLINMTNTSAPLDHSAAIELADTRKGFLPNRLTTAQRDAISNPPQPGRPSITRIRRSLRPTTARPGIRTARCSPRITYLISATPERPGQISASVMRPPMRRPILTRLMRAAAAQAASDSLGRYGYRQAGRVTVAFY